MKAGLGSGRKGNYHNLLFIFAHFKSFVVRIYPFISCPVAQTVSDLTFTFHFHALEKENGNPLQCSCLENPRDGGAWWAAVYGVAQSRTRLKRLSSSSSSSSNGKASTCNAEVLGSIPGLGRSPGEGNGTPLQYSCLENSVGGGAW